MPRRCEPKVIERFFFSLCLAGGAVSRASAEILQRQLGPQLGRGQQPTAAAAASPQVQQQGSGSASCTSGPTRSDLLEIPRATERQSSRGRVIELPRRLPRSAEGRIPRKAHRTGRTIPREPSLLHASHAQAQAGLSQPTSCQVIEHSNFDFHDVL